MNAYTSVRMRICESIIGLFGGFRSAFRGILLAVGAAVGLLLLQLLLACVAGE